MKNLFLFLLLMGIGACKHVNLNKIPCGTITKDKHGKVIFEKKCVDNGETFSIDSFYDDVEINKFYDANLGIEHNYFNKKNVLLRYSFLKEKNILFSILREANKEERVSGNNTIILKNNNKSNASKEITLYVAYPVFTESVSISMFEDSLKSLKKIIDNYPVTKHKLIIVQEIRKDRKYYFETILRLNSGKNYTFKTSL